MQDIESEIQSVLNDPAQMAQIMQIAESLGLQGRDSVSNELPSNPAESSKQTALLNALIPFLPSDKQKRLTRALKIGKLSQIAGLALQQSQETE